MAQATLSCPFGAIHLEDRRGTAQDERFALIFALPPAPHNGGRVPAGFCRITGAQNLSGTLNSHRPTGAWLFQNCSLYDSKTAPGFAEQVAAGAGL